MSTIKDLLSGMKKLREKATHTGAEFFPCQKEAIETCESLERNHAPNSRPFMVCYYWMLERYRSLRREHVPNQERLEKALEIAVEALEKIELSHYEDCVYWEEEDEEADCNCGSYKRRQTALAAIETALRGDS